MGCFPIACRSAEGWNHNFPDNFDGWTVVVNPNVWGGDYGFNGSEWSATNGYLEMIQSNTPWGVIEHSSDVAYGNWSFDIQFNLTQVEPGAVALVNFIGNDLHDLNSESEMYSYQIQFRTVGSAPDYDIVLRLWKISRGNDFYINISEAIPSAGWHHIDVTRTTVSLFSVYLNGSLIMQGLDTGIGTSEMFWLWFQAWQMIDNVEIKSLPSPPPLWGLNIVVVVVFLVVVSFFLRRRRTE